MMVSLPSHICVTRPQWVNSLTWGRFGCNFGLIIFKRISTWSRIDISRHFLWNCCQVNATRHQCWLVNIGSGNDLMLSDNMPIRYTWCWPDIYQHMMSLAVFKIRSETFRTERQFCQNLYMIKRESLQDRPKFCPSGSAVRHLFWRLH